MKVVDSINTNFQFAFNDTSPFYCWQTASGESITSENENYKIWFDGYLHHSGDAALRDFLPELADRIIEYGCVLKGEESGVFNIIVFEKESGRIFLANDPGGLLPFFYAQLPDKLVASTHLNMLANCIHAAPDYLQLIAKEALGYAIGPGTSFNQIKRLLPGELIVYNNKSRSLSSKYTENYFHGYDHSKNDIVEKVYFALEQPVKRVISDYDQIGIMLSEGFDSRLLAAMFTSNGAKVHTYTHGTAGTKGTRIAQQVANYLNLEHTFEEVEYLSTEQSIHCQLMLVDDLTFGFWQGGDSYFSTAPVDAVMAGTALDSTLGGHIFSKPSRNKAEATQQRYFEILFQYSPLIDGEYLEKLSRELLDSILNIDLKRISRRVGERFLPEIAAEFLPHVHYLPECIKAEYDRITRSGTTLASQVLQRFFLEHRARRASFCQELTLRMDNKIVVPSYEPKFLREVLAVPAQLKLNHGLYFKLLNRYFPQTAKIPTGNFFLPANLPRVLLETSRFLGKINDTRCLSQYLSTKGDSEYRKYRGALFMDKNGRDPSLLEFFRYSISQNRVINRSFYNGYLDRIESYEARAYKFEDFYRSIEYEKALANA